MPTHTPLKRSMDIEDAMTVSDLIELLKKEPLDADVWLATNCHGCFEPAAVVRRDDRGMVVIEDERE